MKDKKNKIKILSEKIARYEEQIHLGKNVQENQNKIEKIMESLSVDDYLQIEDYIDEHQLLKNYK